MGAPLPRNDYKLGLNYKDFQVRRGSPPGHSTIINYGPNWLGAREVVYPESGPRAFTLAHPELFATASTSGPEGWFFWGCIQEKGQPDVGFWQYQRQVNPAGNKIGGATVDFVFQAAPRDLAVRIKTPWHMGAGFGQVDVEQSDELSMMILEDLGYTVIDVPIELYMDDESGMAVRRVVNRVDAQDYLLMPGASLFVE